MAHASPDCRFTNWGRAMQSLADGAVYLRKALQLTCRDRCFALSWSEGQEPYNLVTNKPLHSKFSFVRLETVTN